MSPSTGTRLLVTGVVAWLWVATPLAGQPGATLEPTPATDAEA
jgi:hypothetical protein